MAGARAEGGVALTMPRSELGAEWIQHSAELVCNEYGEAAREYEGRVDRFLDEREQAATTSISAELDEAMVTVFRHCGRAACAALRVKSVR